MTLTRNSLIYLQLCAGVLCVSQVSWLPCQFTDEHVFKDSDGYERTELVHREATLQFGRKGDGPVNPSAVTFLVTGSRLDLWRYVEGAEAEQLSCELRRYSTQGIHVRWPVQEPHEYNLWFSCTLRHAKGLFMVTGFLRQPSEQPPPGQQDYLRWPAIGDRDTLTTTVALVIKTQSPTVKAGLGSKQRLHCQFAVDHKAPDVTVEWQWQQRGERSTLFSHNSRSGLTQGSGVVPRGLAGGDASYTLPFSKMKSQGTYTCSVSVVPVFASVDISLQIEEPPRVSLNVGPTLSLQDGAEHKVVCRVEGYYPLDVEIVWSRQDPAASGQRVGAPLPRVLDNILLSSHKHNQDGTYELSAFFYLQASLGNSGRQFTCSVSHRSLRVPVRKSFILSVEDSSSLMFTLSVGVLLVTLLAVLLLLLSSLHSAKRRSVQKKPY